MCIPEPDTMARETAYAGWLSLGHELHHWDQGWSLIPKNYIHPQMDIRACAKGK